MTFSSANLNHCLHIFECYQLFPLLKIKCVCTMNLRTSVLLFLPEKIWMCSDFWSVCLSLLLSRSRTRSFLFLDHPLIITMSLSMNLWASLTASFNEHASKCELFISLSWISKQQREIAIITNWNGFYRQFSLCKCLFALEHLMLAIAHNFFSEPLDQIT